MITCDVPEIMRVVTAGRALAVPIDSRCRATTSSDVSLPAFGDCAAAPETRARQTLKVVSDRSINRAVLIGLIEGRSEDIVLMPRCSGMVIVQNRNLNAN